jgi:hypothetical protein
MGCHKLSWLRLFSHIRIDETLCGQGWGEYTLPVLLNEKASFYGLLYALTVKKLQPLCKTIHTG